jgi:magnesium transporter
MLRDYDKSIQKIETLLRVGKSAETKRYLQEFLPADIAYLASHIDNDLRSLVLEEIKTFENLGDIIHEMDPEIIVDLVSSLEERQIAWLFSQLDTDDSARVISSLPDSLAEWVLSHMTFENSKEAETLLKYNEKKAGRIMSLEFFNVNEHTTVLEAFSELKQSHDAETIYNIYVTDERNHLVGVASLRELLTKANHLTMKEIMNPNVISIPAIMDQEDVANIVERYNFTSVPVVNAKNQIIGVITVDDIIDVIRSEATEDIMKLAGTTEDELLLQSPIKGFLRRMPWLLVSFFGGMLTIQSNIFFEKRLPYVEFIFFITIIAGMGGNIASQSSTIVVRGLATGKILVNELWEVLFREVTIGLLLGLFFGGLLGVVSSVQFSTIPMMGVCVGVGMIGSMLVAATVGSLMPILFQRLNVDPAVATGPFVSTTIDNLGLISYFGCTILIIKFLSA